MKVNGPATTDGDAACTLAIVLRTRRSRRVGLLYAFGRWPCKCKPGPCGERYRAESALLAKVR